MSGDIQLVSVDEIIITLISRKQPEYSLDDVKTILNEKIYEEKSGFSTSTHSIDSNKLSYSKGKLNLLSLFSGCGGLDLGFELAGIEAVHGDKIAKKCFEDKSLFEKYRESGIINTFFANDFFQEAGQSYGMNFSSNIFIDTCDIRKIKDFPQAGIVLGGFPCPGFSEAGPRLVDDERNFLYLHFIRCLMQSQPYIFVAENVKGMITLGKGEVFRQIIEDFSAAGYRIYHQLLDAKNYGVPQTRERVIIIGIRKDVSFEYIFPQALHGPDAGREYVTLKDAIWDLKNKPGAYFTGSFSPIFMSRNRKKRWNQPSYTIQASGRQAPIHPSGAPMVKIDRDKWEFSDGEENNRRLSIKEIARIQTFPDWFRFSDGKNDGIIDNSRLDKMYKQIGNAVPVKLAFEIAKPIAHWAVHSIKNNLLD